jgi:proteasome lid subunit RPN8/RPN11
MTEHADFETVILSATGCRLRTGVLEGVYAHARDARPAECCGILVGRAGDVVDAIRARNLSENPNRFLIDPKDHIDARRRARGRGLDVVGFYHSHPHSPPDPSPADEAEALYADHLYLIVSLACEPPEPRLYRLHAARFVEVPFVIR